MMLSVPELMDVIGIATIIYILVVVANNHIPHIAAKDNPVIRKSNLFNIVKQDIFDAVGDVVNLDKLHCYSLVIDVIAVIAAIAAKWTCSLLGSLLTSLTLSTSKGNQ